LDATVASVYLYLFIRLISAAATAISSIGMGGNQSNSSVEERPLSSSHPRLQGARLASLNGQNVIKLTVPLIEKDYDLWVEKLLAFQKSTSKLMLPVKHAFTPAGACG
jgi:hypothetical protein